MRADVYEMVLENIQISQTILNALCNVFAVWYKQNFCISYYLDNFILRRVNGNFIDMTTWWNVLQLKALQYVKRTQIFTENGLNVKENSAKIQPTTQRPQQLRKAGRFVSKITERRKQHKGLRTVTKRHRKGRSLDCHRYNAGIRTEINV